MVANSNAKHPDIPTALALSVDLAAQYWPYDVGAHLFPRKSHMPESPRSERAA